ncbi:unnamed protein product [Clonostachys byssicola]|uniref:Major facilitator superfamily (MFS) profile domain-containing protein n=1 Tax=Clonostachys byssicola TaxID=160290 RepID=A0A9N9XX36_9HYPO|nr:unnamed protein product [Clonostachys byssicola]
MSITSRFAEIIKWYPKGMPLEERRLVQKIDLLVLVYACLAFFTKYLDVSALNNAYVSGMKEDLHLTGDQLNYINAAYEVGYTVFQIPSNIILTRIPAHYYLPGAEIFWGLFTLGTAFVTDYKQLAVMRFFVGLSATSTYIGCLHVINSWYKKNELGKRNAIYFCANPLGTMFAGYLQAAAYTNLHNMAVYHLHGHHNPNCLRVSILSPSLPYVALTRYSGFIFFPDVPERTTTRWLTDVEKELARTRIQADGFQKRIGLNRSIWKRLFKNWRMYAFVLLGLSLSNSIYGAGLPFILWLKSQPERYDTAMVNNLGTVSSAVTVVSAIIVAFWIDLRQKRYQPALLFAILLIFSNVVLTVWDVPYGLHFFAYLALGAGVGGFPVVSTWIADVFSEDAEARAIVFAVRNTLGEVCSLVVPLVAWPVSHGPKFRGGYIWVSISFCYFDL